MAAARGPAVFKKISGRQREKEGARKRGSLLSEQAAGERQAHAPEHEEALRILQIPGDRLARIGGIVVADRTGSVEQRLQAA